MKKLLFAVMAVFLFTCCTTTRYVPVVEEHTVYKNHTDTFIEKDTIIKEKQVTIREADSAILNQLNIKLKEGERAILILQKELEKQVNKKQQIVHDTTIVHDSVDKPYPVPAELTKYQRLAVDWFGWLAFSFIVFLCFTFYLLFRARNRLF